MYFGVLEAASNTPWTNIGPVFGLGSFHARGADVGHGENVGRQPYHRPMLGQRRKNLYDA